MRKLLLFGNGLGMALKPDFFNLEKALSCVWNYNCIITPYEKKLISFCLPTEILTPPSREEQLDHLHMAVNACELLDHIYKKNHISIENKKIHWLTEFGENFPATCKKYIWHVAAYFHRYQADLPEKFSANLVSYIKNSRSHVATLNYDNLLYKCFWDNNLLDGYNGFLVDGMLNSGFQAENLDRKYNNDFGYYLHLHGSPLFYERDGNIYKSSQGELLTNINPYRKFHLVLTHIRHKPNVIASSYVLRSYWQRLTQILLESEEVIIFGYSGFDEHLNERLSSFTKNIKFKIIEWSGAGSKAERSIFWNKILGKSIDLIQLDDITTFTEWG